MEEREKLRKALAQIITHARLMKGWSLYRLSKESGVSVPSLITIETATCSVRTDQLQKICRVLDLKVMFPLNIG